MLTFLEKLTGETLEHYSASVSHGDVFGFPKQRDGSSCGVFACVTLVHLLRDAKIHYTQSSVLAWRRYMATTILEAGDVMP